MIARSKLNSIESKTSEELINNETSHKEASRQEDNNDKDLKRIQLKSV